MSTEAWLKCMERELGLAKITCAYIRKEYLRLCSYYLWEALITNNYGERRALEQGLLMEIERLLYRTTKCRAPVVVELDARSVRVEVILPGGFTPLYGRVPLEVAAAELLLIKEGYV